MSLRLRFRRPLGVRCEVRDAYPKGGPVPVRIELVNQTERELEVRALGMPWRSPSAVRLKVEDEPALQHMLREHLPLELPSELIPPGESIAGDVDLARHLGTRAGETIADLPGEHKVRIRTRTFLASEQGEDDMIDLECGPVTIRIV